MIDHDLDHDPVVAQAGDYSRCRTAADIERVLNKLPVRRLDWHGAMAAVGRDFAPLHAHPVLAGLAHTKNRLVEALDALQALEGRKA